MINVKMTVLIAAKNDMADDMYSNEQAQELLIGQKDLDEAIKQAILKLNENYDKNDLIVEVDDAVVMECKDSRDDQDN